MPMPRRRAARGVRDPGRRAVEDDLSLVGGEDAVDHLDEGRFSRAVLAQQSVDLARLDAEVDVVVGAHAGKGLADAGELEPQGRFDIHRDRTSLPSGLQPRRRRQATTQESRRQTAAGLSSQSAQLQPRSMTAPHF